MDQKITKEEYIQAVNIIERYHKQISERLKQITEVKENFENYPVSLFLDEHREQMSARTWNAFSTFIEHYPKYGNVDLIRFNFLILQNSRALGTKGIRELEEIRLNVIRDRELNSSINIE